MDFSYKLSESEYLLASRIAAKRPGRPWARALTYGYLTIILLIVWGSLGAGMLLERSDLAGITAADIQRLKPAEAIIYASIVPACAISCMVFLLLRMRPLRWLDRKSRLEHFHADPGCQAETTVTLTGESISFRSAAGSSESIWGCYAAWGERNGVVVLVTRAGVRKILKISDLSEGKKDEFRSILSSALPK